MRSVDSPAAERSASSRAPARAFVAPPTAPSFRNEPGCLCANWGRDKRWGSPDIRHVQPRRQLFWKPRTSLAAPTRVCEPARLANHYPTMLFPKIVLGRGSNKTRNAGRNIALDAIDVTGASRYVVQLPLETSSPTTKRAPQSSDDVAEMLDEDNMAWGSPPKKSKRSKKSRQ
ncbi:hypothetical protein WOLCODRAFT_135017 [Wolfiporia cocos MD-104 SS10]|uniref:Uncharacterized protein n=1 Tax=Wolfiporia cocos (strain MD-104) TaxID=742152 RepID=A0A2H3J0E0_WOLCO|nr:hypothetical protein WOLCODRAFT_135017 [Wolfiporia cocos MD-104 SS10]